MRRLGPAVFQVATLCSECQMDGFVDTSAPTGPGKFYAICQGQ